jgi:hypothetical protein
MMTTVRRALHFVNAEIARHAAIKAQRSLTDDEKRYGNQVLLPLLESIESLLKRLKREGT